MNVSDAFEIGDKVFVPRITQEPIKEPCPDCLGENVWRVSLPSGLTSEVTCPRCHGHSDWLMPRRYERTFKIDESTVGEVSIRRHKAHKGEDIYTSISYGTAPYIGHIDHKRAYRTREEAEAAAAVLIEEYEKDDNERARKERERTAERAGQDIIAALEMRANERFKALSGKIDDLKEKMLEAIRYPTLYGPKIRKTSYSTELTSEGMSEWLSGLLSEADIEGWSEAELHEALCQC